jgi:hypothetical protein
MKLTELQPILERQPFRPFTVRLSSGEYYTFHEERELGAPRKILYSIIYFGESDWVLIDIENITEVINS